MSALKEHVLMLLDHTRGSALPGTVIDALTLVALTAKYAPSCFFDVYKTAKVVQKEKLAGCASALSPDFPAGICDTEALSKVSAEALQRMIYLVHDEVGSFQTFAAAVRHCANDVGAGVSEAGSNLGPLFKALIGNLSGLTVYDAAAGFANVASQLSQAKLRLQELNRDTWRLSYRLLLLEDYAPVFVCGDSLTEPAFIKDRALADVAVIEPPLSYRLSPERSRELSNAKYLLVDPGPKVPASAWEALWVQLALANVHEQGRAVLLLPPGILFRGGYDGKLREYLLEHDLVEAIISLPSGVLTTTGLEPIVLVLNKKKAHEGVIFLVDATHFGRRERRRRVLSQDDIDLIAVLAKGEWANHPSFKAVLLPDVHKNGNDLSLNRYFATEVDAEIPDAEQAYQELREAQQRFDEAQARLMRLLQS